MSHLSRNHTCDTGAYGPCAACLDDERAIHLAAASHKANRPCPHDPYWRTHYGRCAFCLVEKAEEDRDVLLWLLLQTRDYLYSDDHGRSCHVDTWKERKEWAARIDLELAKHPDPRNKI